MTNIAVESPLFARLREKLTLLNCHQCTGFWGGAILGGLLLNSNPVTIFASGCAGSFLAVLAAFVLDYLETEE